MTNPIASRSECSVTSRTSFPSIVTSPSVTSYRRGTSDSSVDLPAPDGPTTASIVPAGTVTLMPSRIVSDASPPWELVTVSSDAIELPSAAG